MKKIIFCLLMANIASSYAEFDQLADRMGEGGTVYTVEDSSGVISSETLGGTEDDPCVVRPYNLRDGATTFEMDYIGDSPFNYLRYTYQNEEEVQALNNYPVEDGEFHGTAIVKKYQTIINSLSNFSAESLAPFICDGHASKEQKTTLDMKGNSIVLTHITKCPGDVVKTYQFTCKMD